MQVFDGGSIPIELGVLSGLRRIVDLVVVILAPEHRFADRTEVELLLEARVEPLIEALRFLREWLRFLRETLGVVATREHAHPK